MSGERMIELLTGDCRELLPSLPEQSVQTIVTSVPYWMARQYTDNPREIGHEATPTEYVAVLVEVFMLCWRVLRNDGTLWLNIGDRYSSSSTYNAPRTMHTENGWKQVGRSPNANTKATGLPPKSLIGLPWRLAFALQDAGWILRTDIIWSKPAPQPESMKDRPTRSHEYVFLFSKSEHYYFDVKAISEPMSERSLRRIQQPTFQEQTGGPKDYRNGTNPNRSARKTIENMAKNNDGTRRPRTIWEIPTQGLRDEHYAPMPQALAERCIKAGSRPSDTVLDPFAGSGTTGRAAATLQRSAILIDLAYQDLQMRRTDKVQTRMEL